MHSETESARVELFPHSDLGADVQDDDTADDWIANRVAAAAASLDEEPLPATTELLKRELRSTMSERALRQSELTDLATRLLESAVPQDDEEVEA